MPEQLSGLLIHAIGTPPWLLTPVKVSTSSELYPDYFWLPTFLLVQASSFLIHHPFLNTACQATLGYLLLAVQHLRYLRAVMPRQMSPALPTHCLPRVLQI